MAATIYDQPAYQSPVRGEPDDLLMLPGDGFAADDRVYYFALPDTTGALVPPTSSASTASAAAMATALSGTADVVSYAGIPHALTVRLPRALRGGQSYALWVRNAAGQWSNGVRINDARPFWVTPAYAYETGTVEGLSRELKMVGRNLNPAPGSPATLKLSGPENLRIAAQDGDDLSEAIRRYAPRFRLPAHLKPGDYRVSFSRDGVSWLSLPDLLRVRPDPPPAREFRVADEAYGGCRADDGLDDTPCIARAIEAARQAGGGTVTLGAGTWDLLDGKAPAIDADNGLVLPPGVSLAGAGAARTRIVRHAEWDGAANQAAFTLIGGNTVRGLDFVDARRYRPDDPAYPTLRLGRLFFRVDPQDPRQPKSVDDVIISGNVFDKGHPAIASGGLPVSRLFVTDNLFGAYDLGLDLGGNRYNMSYKFRVDDSVVAGNTFKPGSYMDPSIQQGAIASSIGAARHLDFSGNVADGAASDFLYSPEDAGGWRAAFFWSMNNDLEMMLVSQNRASCTGDKLGDGEAIAYDNNANTYPFDGAVTVLGATRDTVTVRGSLRPRQNERDVHLADYYDQHWILLGEGRGLGQVRKIVRYVIDAPNGTVTFTVKPSWDVVPEAGHSRVGVGREFWQVYTIDNVIDQRQPLCRKSNRSEPRAGAIVLWAQTADSVVEGNRQYDTDGIGFQQSYSAVDAACPECRSSMFSQSFVEIRGNLVDGEYDWDLDCSASGIWGATSASPTPASPPLTMSYGVSIAHNTVVRADGLSGGAISTPLYWYAGPPPQHWPLVENLLIYGNTIRDMAGASARIKCGANPSGRRSGINLGSSGLVQHSVLSGNSCVNVDAPLQQGGDKAIKVCPSGGANSCECATPGERISP